MHADLSEAFQRAFGARASFVARAPGRVNLIGEHVDDCGLAVLPMTIQRAVRVAFAPRDDGRVRLVNADESRFRSVEFALSCCLEPAERGDWSNYVRAAAQQLAHEHGAKRGVDAFVAGDVPTGAGLSSSSALVVALSLAIAEANGLVIRPESLAETCARAERYVGVQSGGMDQAVSLAGRAGCAVLVEFEPVRAWPVPIPPSWRFVVAHSGVRAEKAGRARDAYNARVTECRAALARALASPDARGWPATWRELLRGVGSERLLSLGERALDGVLLRRFRHVVGEGARVARAVTALERASAAEFARLMDASHESLRGDYEVSCAELDDLVRAAREAGALGARLTGAGFGGAIVALVDAQDAERVGARLRARPGASADPDAVFVAEPGPGASVERAW